MAHQRNTNIKSKAKILIVEKDVFTRQQIAKHVEFYDDVEICAGVSDFESVLRAIEITTPDIAIIDLSLDGDLKGLELLKNIKVSFPLLDALIISMLHESVFAIHAFKAGAKGYLMKDQINETLIYAIHQILNEGIYLSDNVTGVFFNTFVRRRMNKHSFADYCLSEPQLKILELIAGGLDITQIAEELHISVEKVNAHHTAIMQKLQINNISQLRSYATEWFTGGMSPQYP